MSIKHMAVRYTIMYSLQIFSKYTKIGFFGLQIYPLATLEGTKLVPNREMVAPTFLTFKIFHFPTVNALLSPFQSD